MFRKATTKVSFLEIILYNYINKETMLRQEAKLKLNLKLIDLQIFFANNDEKQLLPT